MKKYLWISLGLLIIISLIQSKVTYAQSQQPIETAIEKSLSWLKMENPESKTSTYSVTVADAIEASELDLAYYRIKILEIPINRVHVFWYDQNLNAVTESEAFTARAEAYIAKYGKLNIDLYRMLNETSDSKALIPVAVWANQPMIEETTTPPLLTGSYLVYLPLVKKPGALDQIINFITLYGYQIDYIAENAPVVYASMPSTLISELQAKDYVAAIYQQTESVLSMESAARTSAAPWTWSRGITGTGVKVTVVENDGVAFDNPYLNGSKYYDSEEKRIDYHATNVAGVIASTHPTYRGIAYGAEILSANADSLKERDIIKSIDWALGEGTDIINASFGTVCAGPNIQSNDKYFDWVVWKKQKTVVVSSGNLRNECKTNFYVSSPGKGYNVITVGSKNDRNTATTTDDVKDDIFSYFSLYVDPVTATENRLKPEVVATGERIITTSETSPWIRSSETQGTSFSAPIVAGEAALMMQRSDWLKYSPEAVKAGIMATARWTYLHDDQNYNQWTSIEKMGVGAIDVTAADNSLINNRIRQLYLKKGDFNNNYYDIVVDGCPQGERFRTVITWPSHPSRTIFNWILLDRLESDFDLTVQAANGQIFGSYADEANYEIVEFVSPQTGQATIRIHLSRWDNFFVTERIGLSYYCGSPLD